MPKSPQEIIEEDDLQRDVEFLELVKFSRELYRDNLKIVQENKDLKAKRTTSKLVTWLFDDRDGGERMWGLFGGFVICVVFLSLLLLVGVSAVNHGTTGSYYTQHCTFSEYDKDREKNVRRGGTRVMQEIDWGVDIGASECLDNPGEAVRLMKEMSSNVGND